MDQTHGAVSPGGAGDPSGSPPAAAGGDAATARLAELDALLAERLATIKDEIAKAAADRAVRDTMRTYDARFNRIEPMLQSIPRLQQDVTNLVGHFTKAEEADLDPDERRRRDYDRQLQEANNRTQQAIFQTRMYNAGLKAQRALADLGMSESDQRIAHWFAPEGGIQQNPEEWASSFILEVSKLARQDLEARLRQTADTSVATERRRSQQIEETARVQEQNTRREAARGRLETSQPTGQQVLASEAMRDLYHRDRKACARAMEASAKAIVRGDITDPSQLKF